MRNRDTDIVERETHIVHEPVQRRGGMLAGFVLALLLLAGAVVGYLIVSDDDDDGRVDFEVPTVDVDADVDVSE